MPFLWLEGDFQILQYPFHNPVLDAEYVSGGSSNRVCTQLPTTLGVHDGVVDTHLAA